MSLVAVEGLLANKRTLYATPKQEQAAFFWEKCNAALAEAITAGLVKRNESLHTLKLEGHEGQIRAKTAWDANTLRGDYADLLILDEYAYMKPDAWAAVGAPMLLDNDGDAWFVSSPARKNHFYALYVRGLQDGERWKSWRFTSHENPHLSEQALAEIIQDMAEDDYKQEILAEFLENEGAVFRNLAACMKALKNAKPQDHAGHRIVAGVDWGKQDDFTAISVFCADCRRELAHERFRKVDYHVQRGRLVSIVKKWGVKLIKPEANSMGQPIIDELSYDPGLKGVSLKAFTTSQTSKPPLIQGLALAFEREQCQWLDDPLWTVELEAYEVSYNANTGKPVYSAPEGVHDDTMIARSLAWQGIDMTRHWIY